MKPKRASRVEKEKKILLGLVAYYLKTGKPVGSCSLQEAGFQDISSATIRNCFSILEKEGYLEQQHISGGRIPKSKAFTEYARNCLEIVQKEKTDEVKNPLQIEVDPDSFELFSLLQEVIDKLSRKASIPAMITAPRFDHDIVQDLRFVFLDVKRALAVITTEFGLVHTQVLSSKTPLSHAVLRKAERFARSRLFNEPLESDLFDEKELNPIKDLYQEAMASYFIHYTSISQEDILQTGFSKLLQYPEFEETFSLFASVSLFENKNILRNLMRESMRKDSLMFWIGDDLKHYVTGEPNCALVAIPYKIGKTVLGAISVLGPMRMFYEDLFRLLQETSSHLSYLLDRYVQKHKISWRMPESRPLFLEEARLLSLDYKKDQ